MANENHDPWALLREARESMGVLVDIGWIPAEMSNAESRAVECINRIDAALADHEAIPPSKEKVEWKRQVQTLRFADKKIILWAFGDGTWGWGLTGVEQKPVQGNCATEAEAKSAAIAAARGMR